MVYEDRYKEFEQNLTSGEPGVDECAYNWSMAVGLQDRISTDLGRQNFCLNKPRFFFETSHYHKQPKF